MCITKETKLQLSCHCHDNSCAADPVFIRTKMSRFYLAQRSSTLNNLMGRRHVGTMAVLGKTPCPTQKRGYLVFHRKRLEPRVLSSLKITAPIFLFLDSVFHRFSGTIYDVITFLICIIQKCEYF